MGAGLILWVVTGQFSSGGGQDEASAAQPNEISDEAAPVTVGVLTARTSEYRQHIRIPGATGPDKQTLLVARTEGVVAELPFEKGAKVGRGAVVARLDGPDILAAVETAQALLNQRSAEEEAARRLFENGNSAQLSLDAAISARAAAEAQLKQAEAAADRLRVRAPFAGLLDRRLVEEGNWVQPGSEIANLLALDPILVSCMVSERDVNTLRLGDTAEVRLADGQSVSGTLRFIGRDADPKTRTFPVEVAVANPEDAIRSGMTAEVTLRAAPRDVVIVPRSAVVLTSEGLLAVRVLDGDDVAHTVPVELVEDGGKGLYLAGIEEGTRVVVNGLDLFGDGARVAPVPVDRADLAAR